MSIFIWQSFSRLRLPLLWCSHYFSFAPLPDIAALPAIGSLFGALFQLSRDSIAHERTVALEEIKNRFTVGATSHMANVAFDKHVGFSAEYLSMVQQAMLCLYQKGPTPDILPFSKNLYEIRKKWVVLIRSSIW